MPSATQHATQDTGICRIARDCRGGFMKSFPIVVLLCLAWASPCQATVTSNCGLAGSDFGTDCSLQELIGGGSITVNGVTFDTFTWQSQVFAGSLGPLTAIRVDGVDSRSRPALTFTDTGTSWDRAGLTVTINHLGFRVRNGGSAAFTGRRMYGAFGDIFVFN